MRRIDITGQRFSKLEVVRYYGLDKHKEALWLCKCDCGNETIVNGCHLRSGHTKTCRKCFLEEGQNERVYRIWREILTRCYNKGNKRYKDYGGRGIVMCDEWKSNFKTFYKWAMANGYQDDLTIDRINVNGNYEPSNCRWATWLQQANNKRNNRVFTYNGETLTLKQLAIKYGVDYRKTWSRLKLGWTIEQAIEGKKKWIKN